MHRSKRGVTTAMDKTQGIDCGSELLPMELIRNLEPHFLLTGILL